MYINYLGLKIDCLVRLFVLGVKNCQKQMRDFCRLQARPPFAVNVMEPAETNQAKCLAIRDYDAIGFDIDHTLAKYNLPNLFDVRLELLFRTLPAICESER